MACGVFACKWEIFIQISSFIFGYFDYIFPNDSWKNIEPLFVLNNMKTFYKRFFSQQFKRNCVPDGIKVGSISLSPRADWRMPSDAVSALWLDSLK